MIRVYRALLRLYPRRFRERYADEMLRAFEDGRRAAEAAGTLWRFSIAAVADVLKNGVGERAGRRGPGLRSPRAWPNFASLHQDVRFAGRMLRRRAVLTSFSAATYALGIAAITAIASITDAVLIQPLPFPEPHAIVAVRGLDGDQPAGLSLENLRDLRAASSTLTALTPFFAQSVNLTGVPEPDRLRGAFVSSDFFAVVATNPAMGHPFGPDSDIPSGERAVVLTDGAWRRRFGASRDIIGRQLMLNNAPFTVVGVMPAGFDFPIDEAEVFMPAWANPSTGGRGNHNFFGVGRLANGVSVRQASAELGAIAEDLERTYPDVNRGRRAMAEPLKAVLADDAASPLLLLLTMAGIMLLAACGNVAGLELGATASRRREFAVRAALGAGRGRIARQLLVESVVRAGLGAAIGIPAAWFAVKLAIVNAPLNAYGIDQATIRPWVLAAVVLATLLSGVAAGLPSMWHWTRSESLNVDRTTGEAAASRLRRTLVISQMAIAAALVIAAGLMARSFSLLSAVDPGFDPRHLLTMEYRLPRNKYITPQAQAAFHDAVLERVRALPGVIAAAGIRALPFSGNGNEVVFRLSRDDQPREAFLNTTTGPYFETMRIPLVAGRLFEPADRHRTTVIVSRAFAQRNWPGRIALGREVYFDGADLTATVVGVVGDVHHRDLTAPDGGVIYSLQDRNPGVFNTLVVRTSGEPLALADSVRRGVWSVDPDQPVWKIRTVESLIDRSMATRRFLLQLIGLFGISAATLGAMGLYGVVAAGVSQRTREIGVRIALGATRRDVLGLVMSEGTRLGGAGIGVGVLGAFLGARLLSGFLFGISSHDPLTYVSAATVLMSCALLACWLPGRRALRVDPAVALRDS